MTVEEAIQFFGDAFEKTKENEYIRKPLAYALYKTWKKADSGDVAEFESLDNATSVDAVEVVRCKDCSCFDGVKCNHPQREESTYGVYEDDFCSYGERRDG